MLQLSSNNCKIDLRCPRGNKPAKKKKKTLDRISPPTSPLLTHLIRSSHLSLSKLLPLTRKKTLNTTKILGIGKHVSEAKIYLHRVPTSLPRKKKKTFPKLCASTIRRKIIMLTSFLRRGKSQITSVSLGYNNVTLEWRVPRAEVT